MQTIQAMQCDATRCNAMQCDAMVGWDPYDVTVNASDVMLQSMQSVHASVDGSNQTIGEAKVIALDATVATVDAIIC